MHHPIAKISVVIPVFNEELCLGAAIASVGQLTDTVEVIVVDGGSIDNSRGMAARAGARVVVSPVRQRAAQMNLGAQHARGDVLLFLHADTILPPNWFGSLVGAFDRRTGCVGGAFRRRFDLPSPVLRSTSRLSDWRGRWLGVFLGDQAIFARRKVFTQLGGFQPLSQFEDFDFSRRLTRRGTTVLLNEIVLSSGRRFLGRGPVRQTLADLVLTWRFLRRPDAFVERPEPMTDEGAAGRGAAALLPPDRGDHRRQECRRSEGTCRLEPR